MEPKNKREDSVLHVFSKSAWYAFDVLMAQGFIFVFLKIILILKMIIHVKIVRWGIAISSVVFSIDVWHLVPYCSRHILRLQ